MPIYAYFIAAIFFFGSGWTVNGWRMSNQIAEIKSAQSNTIVEGVKNALNDTIVHQNRKDNALAEANKRATVLAVAATNARNESDGLRSDLSKARADLFQATNGTGVIDPVAARELLDAMEQGIDRLASKGSSIAKNADGHTSDILTLRMSWPKDSP